MDYKYLFNTIDELDQEFIQRWVDISNIESPTVCKEGNDKIGEYFVNIAKEYGWKIDVLENEFSGNVVCITMNPDVDAQPISLSGHIDTVHAIGSFGNPPVRIEDGKIYGPGVMDCKGGTVAALQAMVALHKIGFNKRPVKLLLQTDEEVNSMQSKKATINYIIEQAKGSIGFLNLESCMPGYAVLWRKGIARYKVDIKGKSIHASRCVSDCANAILEAAHKIIEFEKFKDVEGITCNCGIINGGTSANTVPDYCSFIAEYRFYNDKELEQLDKVTYDIVNKSFVEGTTATVERIGLRVAMEKCDRNFDLLDKMNEIYKKVGLPILTARLSLGGSDAADITHAGIPCIDSIGVTGDFIHTPKEFAYIGSLNEAAKRIASVVYFL
ncbi:MAG: M20 family metallopeptidase [Clostridiales bacterium]|nr:M20 family metallopeptidase [Clostridiales bacterium]